jgi:NADPH-dependent glutamate synthase beta subunit-like oxidoreductase
VYKRNRVIGPSGDLNSRTPGHLAIGCFQITQWPDHPITRSNKPRPKVAIVGADFAGLTASRRIARLPVQVTVIDRK